jgi:hypothetical protein
MQVVVFWVVTPCSAVVGYQHFRRPYCLHLHSLLPEDGGSMELRNVGILSQHYTASQPRRPRLLKRRNLYASPNITVIKYRIRWAGNVARMGGTRNAYNILDGKPQGKRPLGRPRRRRKGSEAHPTSYSTGTGGSFLGGKAAGA